MQDEPIPERDFGVLERETVYLMTSAEQPPVWALANTWPCAK